MNLASTARVCFLGLALVLLLVIGTAPAALAQTPAQVGQWAGPFNWPFIAVHLTLLPTGQVLGWDAFEFAPASERLWNPATGVFTQVPSTSNLFCSGHSLLADGRLLVAGGHISSNVGLDDVNIFDPVTRQWSVAAPMAYGRWYPTATTLGDGRVIVTTGTINCIGCYAPIPEIYDPKTNSWTQLTNATAAIPLYPYVFLLPDGRILSAGTNERPDITRVLNIATQTWTTVDPTLIDGGSAVMYRTGKVMKSGTAAQGDFNPVPSSGSTYVLDMSQPSPAWRLTGSPMAFPRAYHTLTLLPDGNVLVTGGGRTKGAADVANAVFEAELWSPATETWTTLARGVAPRLYHSTALLLPDARVLVAGGGRYIGSDQLNAEIYSPPYLFKGPRPTITSAPGAMGYLAPFSVGTPDAGSISSVALVRLGSVTHTVNQDQRYVPLNFQTAPGGLQVEGPASGNIAPPGYYMLFLVNSAGVPSVSRMVLLSEDSDQDGLPDAWEMSFFGNLSHNGAEDADGDGLTNTQELAAGTNPTAADTDGDGYSDGVEVAAGSDPRNPASTPTPALSVSPSSLSFSGVQGVEIPQPQTLSITNTGGNTFTWTATVNQPWLSVSPATGSPNRSVTVTVSTAGLLLGSYNGTITVTAPGALNSPRVVPVSLVIAPPGPPGLVAAYSLNEGSGTTIVDGSGNANHGVISGAGWTTQGRFGNALTFDGVDDVVTIPDAATLDLSAGGTIEVSVKLNALGRWHGVIAKGNVNTALAHNYAIGITDTNRVQCIFGNGVSYSQLDSTSAVVAGQFYHLACTWNGTTLALYINGALNASATQHLTPAGNTAPLFLGQFGGNSDRLSGTLDEVRIFNRALTLAEIQQNMNTPLGGGTPPPPDTTPPLAPSNLTATAISATQINLAWTAATDNVGVTGYLIERCQGSGCSNFTQIATTAALGFNNTSGLQAATPYSYRVRATDAATNLGPYSNTATATTQALPPADTAPPSAPSNLTASAISTTQINLAWSAATDNVGVTSYLIERCQDPGCANFSQIAATTALSFNNTTGLQAGTTYRYRVRASDAVPNLGPYSNTATATTPASPPPTQGLVAAYAFNEGAGTTTADSSGNANHAAITGATWTTQGRFGNALTFDGVDDFVTVPDAPTLDLSAGGTIEASVKLNALGRWHGVIAKGNVNSAILHNYAIEITDTNRVRCILGNGSSFSLLDSTIAVATGQFYHLACTWNGATVSLYINGALNASVVQHLTPAGNTAPFFIGQVGGNSDRLNGTIDEVRIFNRALTLAEIQEDMNTPLGGGTPPPPDTTPPSAPSNLTATAISATQINLAWTAATDNVGVTSYLIERCQGSGCSNFTQIATTAALGFNNTSGLQAATSYSYRVRATDAAPNLGPYSNTATATTQALPPADTTPPSAPSNLTATAISTTQINLAWAAATDNVGVTSYLLERCQDPGCASFAQIATTTATSFNNTSGLQAGTSYSYRVRATDAATNLGPYSNTATATTPASPPPTQGLVAAYAFSEGAGTTTADGSGNANHAAITGATWTTQGRFGNALTFNGTTALLAVPDAPSLDLAGQGTIEASVRLNAVNRWNSVLAKGNANNNAAHNYALEVTNVNRVRCILGNGAGFMFLDSTLTIATGQFYHLACAWNGTTLSLYVNGTLNASAAQALTPAGNSSQLFIGQFGGKHDRLSGTIDEVRIYNRALSATEIQQDLNTPIP